MKGGLRTRPRNSEAERRERLRYDFLERLYVYTSGDCRQVAELGEIEDELGGQAEGLGKLLVELEGLGHVRRLENGRQICLTPEGSEYLRRGAWRRRSVRG